MLNTSCNDWRLSFNQRHCLTLHVRTHQRTRCIVVFKERNQRCSNRNKLFRAYIHIVNKCCVYLTDIITDTASYTLILKATILVKLNIRLSNNIFILFICLQIFNIVSYNAVLLVNLTIRGLDKAIFINFCISCK